MKIEYLKDGSDDCPLIRIYGDEPESISLLKDALDSLITGSNTKVIVNELNGYVGINHCYLELEKASVSKGILHIKDNHFKCLFTEDKWIEISELLQPLCGPLKNGYQWLDDTSNTSLLVSRYEDGQW